MRRGNSTRSGRSFGVGVDIIELKRFRGLCMLARVAEFVLTSNELKIFSTHPDPATHLASRFVIKEAVIKAYRAPLTYHDIEIVKHGVRPVVKIRGRDMHDISISITHSVDYVAGFAIAH